MSAFYNHRASAKLQHRSGGRDAVGQPNGSIDRR